MAKTAELLGIAATLATVDNLRQELEQERVRYKQAAASQEEERRTTAALIAENARLRVEAEAERGRLLAEHARLLADKDAEMKRQLAARDEGTERLRILYQQQVQLAADQESRFLELWDGWSDDLSAARYEKCLAEQAQVALIQERDEVHGQLQPMTEQIQLLTKQEAEARRELGLVKQQNKLVEARHEEEEKRRAEAIQKWDDFLRKYYDLLAKYKGLRTARKEEWALADQQLAYAAADIRHLLAEADDLRKQNRGLHSACFTLQQENIHLLSQGCASGEMTNKLLSDNACQQEQIRNLSSALETLQLRATQTDQRPANLSAAKSRKRWKFRPQTAQPPLLTGRGAATFHEEPAPIELKVDNPAPTNRGSAAEFLTGLVIGGAAVKVIEGLRSRSDSNQSLPASSEPAKKILEGHS